MAETAADPIDLKAGARMRARRRELGMSQTALGLALGVTFQQVQKYERGINRLSASTLWRVAEQLRVPVGFFFPEPDDQGDDEPLAAAITLAGLPGGQELAKGYALLDTASRASIRPVPTTASWRDSTGR